MAETVLKEMFDQDEDTLGGRFLTFSLGYESYGIEIRYVTEIIVMQPVTEVPELPEYIRGIVNLRGKIIPVMDVRLRFKKSYREYCDRTCVIVIEIDDFSIGLIVDGVSEVISISESEIVDPPQFNKTGNKFIKGVGKIGNEVKLILDCYKLLSDEETETLLNIL